MSRVPVRFVRRCSVIGCAVMSPAATDGGLYDAMIDAGWLVGARTDDSGSVALCPEHRRLALRLLGLDLMPEARPPAPANEGGRS